jgi:5-methyltetrahydropteroyltriglutamate--homocysteine methyltransferase
LSGLEPIAVRGDAFSGTGGAREERDFPEYFAQRPNLDAFVRGQHAPPRRVCCTGPIGWKDFSAVEADIANLSAATSGLGVADAFLSATSPGNVLQKTPNHFYRSDEEYLQAVSDALESEYRAIVDAGLVLQLDCPDLASRSGRGGGDLSLEEFRNEIARNVEALNYATRKLPPDQMRIHVCWGSDERPHHLDPELQDFVDILLRARPAGMTIVAANGRHDWEWRIWSSIRLPEGKVLIPGVIDSTTNIIEHPNTVADRILRFAEVLGKENIIAGVDCGFQSTAGRDQVDPKIAWAKLASLGRGASLASRHLWAELPRTTPV